MSELDMIVLELRDDLKVLINETFKNGMEKVFKLLEEETRHPSCLSCKFCQFDADPLNDRFFPSLSGCANSSNWENPEFEKIFNDFTVNFEVVAPETFGCHKFDCDKFRIYTEIIED